MRNKKLSAAVGMAVMIVAATHLPMAQAAVQEKVLHTFGSNANYGVTPGSQPIFDTAGSLYGTTESGGTGNVGTVYKLTTRSGGGWTETLLYSFHKHGGDGQNPTAGVVFDSVGNLYGTTENGGANGEGTVFELSPPVSPSTLWTEAILYNFTSTFTDGENPVQGLVIDSAGNLYGTARFGGSGTVGAVFEVSPVAGGGWTQTTLHNFGVVGDGNYPNALIRDSVGNLYGTTTFGTANACNCGTVFKLTPSGSGDWTEQVIYSFGDNDEDGHWPEGGLVFDSAGNLYGTTSTAGPGGGGTVFELILSESGSWAEKNLYAFGYNNPMDGTGPFGVLTFGSVGQLYTTTLFGGSASCGTVVELKSSGGPWSEEVIHNFANGTDGCAPGAGVTLDSAGHLYGTTVAGGSFNGGVVFEVAP